MTYEQENSAYAVGDLIGAGISGLAYGGWGVSKDSGRVIFVRRGVPGDELKIRIIEARKNFARAEIVEIVNPSPARIGPECGAFEKGCGGCQWLHINYKTQARWKETIVGETLKRIGGLDCDILPIVESETPYLNRNSASIHIDAKDGLCGFMAENTHTILASNFCRCLEADCRKAFQTLSGAVSRGETPAGITGARIRSGPNGDWGVCFYGRADVEEARQFAEKLAADNGRLRGAGIVRDRKYKGLFGGDHIRIELNSIKHLIHVDSFFQTNYRQAARLSELVNSSLELKKDDSLLDLYCGGGLFALELAGRVNNVLGIENNKLSVDFARRNARLNGIDNAGFISSDVLRGLRNIKKGEYNAAVLDPPRGGCGKETAAEISRISPQRICYVSCAPDTLARDLAWFAKSGYRVLSCRSLDMFPNTYHSEVVATLILK